MIGYLFEPFEGNKKSIKKLIGIIINFSECERNRLWNLVDNLYYGQLNTNIFNNQSINEVNNGNNSFHIYIYLYINK